MENTRIDEKIFIDGHERNIFMTGKFIETFMIKLEKFLKEDKEATKKKK